MPDHVQQTIDGVTDAAVADAIAAVRNHPNYGQIVEALASKALDALATGL
jgi:hypothetical protein